MEEDKEIVFAAVVEKLYRKTSRGDFAHRGSGLLKIIQLQGGRTMLTVHNYASGSCVLNASIMPFTPARKHERNQKVVLIHLTDYSSYKVRFSFLFPLPVVAESHDSSKQFRIFRDYSLFTSAALYAPRIFWSVFKSCKETLSKLTIMMNVRATMTRIIMLK